MLNFKLLVVIIDNKLNFHEHIARLSVLNRLKLHIPFDSKLKLIDAFILSYLKYCSSVHFRLESDSDKLGKLNEGALRSVFQDWSSNYEVLSKKAGKTALYNRPLLNTVTLVCKALNNLAPFARFNCVLLRII